MNEVQAISPKLTALIVSFQWLQNEQNSILGLDKEHFFKN